MDDMLASMTNETDIPVALPPSVREYMAALGRKGGSATSDKKAKASRRNGKKRKLKKQLDKPNDLSVDSHL